MAIAGRRRQKKRRRQRQLIRRVFGQLIAAESKKDDEGPHRITREEAAAADRAGLIDEENLTLFLDWYQLGGFEHGIGINELAEMPATRRHDVLYLLGELGKARKSAEKGKGKP